MTDPIIALVMPCYNEAANLHIARVRDWFADRANYRLICVDDGSTDNTPSLLAELHQSLPEQIDMHTLAANAGKGEAVRQGVQRALESPGVALVGYFDADLATPLDELPRLVACLIDQPEADFAVGARVKMMGCRIERKPWRHALGRCFAAAAAATLKLPIYDTQCGAKIIRVADWTAPLFAEPFASRWVFDVELLARYQQYCTQQNLAAADRIIELPLREWRDVGQSKVRPTDFVKSFFDLIHIARRYR